MSSFDTSTTSSTSLPEDWPAEILRGSSRAPPARPPASPAPARHPLASPSRGPPPTNREPSPLFVLVGPNDTLSDRIDPLTGQLLPKPYGPVIHVPARTSSQPGQGSSQALLSGAPNPDTDPRPARPRNAQPRSQPGQDSSQALLSGAHNPETDPRPARPRNTQPRRRNAQAAPPQASSGTTVGGVFPPGLKAKKTVGRSPRSFFQCDLCGHGVRTLRDFTRHQKDGALRDGFSIFRAVPEEAMVWYGSDRFGNQYSGLMGTGSLKGQTRKIPGVCGLRIRAKKEARRNNASS